jgi:hypothetical protein
MDQIIARSNIDHYLNLLYNGHTRADDRVAINKMLVTELDKLDLEMVDLEYAESRAVACRRRFDQISRWRNGFADGSIERAQADKVAAQFESTLQIVDTFCGQMRERVYARAS